MMIYQLTRGQRFKVAGCDLIFTFDGMQGMFGFAVAEDGRHIHWSGPVELVDQLA